MVRRLDHDRSRREGQQIGMLKGIRDTIRDTERPSVAAWHAGFFKNFGIALIETHRNAG